jgi:hypothetical protein
MPDEEVRLKENWFGEREDTQGGRWLTQLLQEFD